MILADLLDFSEIFCETCRDSSQNFAMNSTSFDFAYKIIIRFNYFSAKYRNLNENSLIFELFSQISKILGSAIFSALNYGTKRQNRPARSKKEQQIGNTNQKSIQRKETYI